MTLIGQSPIPVEGAPAVAAPGRRRRPASRSGIGWLLAAAVPALIFIPNRLGATIGPFDPFLGLLVALAVDDLVRRRSPVRGLLGNLSWWFWLVLFASIVSMAVVGLTAWGIANIAIDAFSFCLFLAAFHLGVLDHTRGRQFRWALLVGFVFEAAVVLTGPAYRPSGTMGNSNLAGHFLALAGLLLVAVMFTQPVIRGFVVVLGLAALVRTGSFGSVAMVLAGALYYAWIRLRNTRGLISRFVLVVLVAGFVGSTYVGLHRFDAGADYQVSPGLTSKRLDRSQSLRFTLWRKGLDLVPDNLLGVGPSGISHRNLLGRHAEIHNDYLSFLVERGLLGFVGLAGILVTLWRKSRPAGAARLVLVAVAAGGLFRETLHFRHVWLLLGLAFAWDHLARTAAARTRPTTPVTVAAG